MVHLRFRVADSKCRALPTHVTSPRSEHVLRGGTEQLPPNPGLPWLCSDTCRMGYRLPTGRTVFLGAAREVRCVSLEGVSSPARPTLLGPGAVRTLGGGEDKCLQRIEPWRQHRNLWQAAMWNSTPTSTSRDVMGLRWLIRDITLDLSQVHTSQVWDCGWVETNPTSVCGKDT